MASLLLQGMLDSKREEMNQFYWIDTVNRRNMLCYPDTLIAESYGNASSVSCNRTILCIAAESGDVKAVKEILRYGGSVNFVTVEGHSQTALGYALNSMITIIGQCKMRGGGYIDSHGENEMCFLIQDAYMPVVEALLEVGCDANQRFTTLCSNDLCPTCSSNGIPQFLKDHRNLTSSLTVLGMALGSGWIKIVQCLLKWGADPEMLTIDGTDINDITVVSRTNMEIFQNLASHFKLKQRPPLLCLCQSGKQYELCHGEAKTKKADIAYPDDMFCPCKCGQAKKSIKSYSQCCKRRGVEYFQGADLSISERRKMPDEGVDMIKSILDVQKSLKRDSFNPAGYLFPKLDEDGNELDEPMDAGEVTSRLSSMLEQFGAHPAYVACHKDVGFFWNPDPQTYLQLPKTELNKRQNEWNKALEKYIQKLSEEGTDKDTLQDVKNRFTVSLLRDCCGPNCSSKETEKFTFKACSNCKLSVYCSRECQKQDWKNGHKKKCPEIVLGSFCDLNFDSAFSCWAYGWEGM